MALFGSLLGAGVSLLGSALSSRKTRQGAQAALQASNPLSVFGPFGSSQFQGGQINQTLGPELQQALGLFSGLTQNTGLPQNALNPARAEESFNRLNRTLDNSIDAQFLARLNQLRGLAAPGERQLRDSTRSQVFNQGRLGLGVGGGIGNRRFQPELAALEEGLARADLGRIDTAFDFSRQDRQRQIAEEMGLQGLFQSLRNEQFGRQLGASGEVRSILGVPLNASAIGIQGRTPAGIAGMAANPFNQQARGIETFFAGLGPKIAGSGIFGGGGTTQIPPGTQPSTFTGPELFR